MHGLSFKMFPRIHSHDCSDCLLLFRVSF